MAVPVQSKPRRRRTAREGAAEILDAARQLFEERPAHAVNVSAIMERTTLSRKSFYVYFRDRYALITRLVSPLRARGDEIMARAQQLDNPVATIRFSLDGIARHYVEHGRLLRALADASGEDQEAARVWREFTEPAIQLAARLIEQGKERGEVRDLDPEPTARVLIRMNLAAFFDQLVDAPDPNVDGVVETLLRVWIRTLYLVPPDELPTS